MDIRFKLDKPTLRRLKSVVKVTDTTIIRCANNKITFIGDNTSHFKALSLDCSCDSKYTFRVDQDVLSFLDDNDECIVSVTMTDSMVLFQCASNRELLDNGIVSGISRTPYSSIDEHLLSDILKALKSVETSLFSIKELANLKEVIAAATACEIGIEISNGLLVSSSNSIKMYKEVEDKELELGLTLEAIKEIEKFKTDCKMHSCLNYLLLSRDSFVLGVKKGISSKITYPEHLRDKSQASSGAIAQINNFASALSVYNKRLDKDHPGSCVFDFGESTLYINNGKSQFFRPLVNKQIECASGIGISKITVPLAVLHKLSSLFKSNDSMFEVYTYGKIIRFSFPSGINILVMGEVC